MHSFNLKNHQQDHNKVYLPVKDPYEANYQLLINKRERVGWKHFKDQNALIEYSNQMDDIYIILKITTQGKNINY